MPCNRLCHYAPYLALSCISLLLHGCNLQIPKHIEGHLIVNKEGNLEFAQNITWRPLFPKKEISAKQVKEGYLEDEEGVVFSPDEIEGIPPKQ